MKYGIYLWTNDRVSQMSEFVQKINSGETEVQKFENIDDLFDSILA